MIQAWRLKKCLSVQAFAVYANGERVVVVSGMGKIAMAGAVAYVMAMFNESLQPILINLGVAGHGSQPLGSVYWLDKISDAETGRHFYPQLPGDVACQSLPLKTVATACDHYPEACLYDMEASAFYEMAVRFSTSELIHGLKVVSDNCNSPLSNVGEFQVEAWITAQLAVVEQLIAVLSQLRRLLSYAPYGGLGDELMAHFHFSSTNAVKLTKLLNRWQLLFAGESLDWRQQNLRNAGDFLTWLENKLDSSQFYL